MLLDFTERAREGERERNLDMREKHPPVTSHRYPPRTKSTTQAHALTRNRTCELSVYGTTLQVSHTSQGKGCVFEVSLDDMQNDRAALHLEKFKLITEDVQSKTA